MYLNHSRILFIYLFIYFWFPYLAIQSTKWLKKKKKQLWKTHLLMLLPSFSLSPAAPVFVARSLPAKSTKLSLPTFSPDVYQKDWINTSHIVKELRTQTASAACVTASQGHLVLVGSTVTLHCGWSMLTACTQPHQSQQSEVNYLIENSAPKMGHSEDS